MAIQTFVADTILTAAQMNALQANDYNQTVSTKTASYVLVAADKGTKLVMNAGATSTTITVNTSLFAAGDTLTILNTSTSGTCTITAGTATVASAGSLALGLNQGGTLYFTSAGVSVFQADGVTATSAGLVLVSATTIGTTVSSVTVSSAFSATYDNYFINIGGGISSASTSLRMTLGATATGYYAGGLYNTFASATTTATNQSNTAFWTVGAGSANSLSASINLTNPNLAKVTLFSANFMAAVTNGDFNIAGGFLNDTTAYTAFTITPTSGTLTGGTIRVYGYTNS